MKSQMTACVALVTLTNKINQRTKVRTAFIAMNVIENVSIRKENLVGACCDGLNILPWRVQKYFS